MSDDARQDDTFEFTLQRPKTVKGKTYKALTVRRPLVRDLIAAERQPGETGRSAALMAICADIPFGDLGHLDGGDFRDLVAEADKRDFFGGSTPATPGDSSSPSTEQPAGDSASS